MSEEKLEQEKQKKPVILQILPAMVIGGVERGTVDMAEAIVKAGYDALVISAGGPMVHQIERIGGRHITLPVNSKNPMVIHKNIARIQEVIENEGVSLVHVRSRAPAWSAYYAAKRANIPFITTFHGTYNFEGKIKKYYNSIMQRSDIVIAISDFIRDHMIDNYQTPWSKIRTVHRGTDLEIFDPVAVPASRVVQLATDWRLPDGVPTVMLSGRLTRWKGQLLLLDALAQLDMDVHCILVGSGKPEFQKEIENHARALSLGGRVYLVGSCRDMPAAYKLADVVVSASTDPEAFGRVAVEGQAMGRPVVAPNHGGAIEQIEEGKTGWLFQHGDASDLARQLKKALSLTPEEREAFYYRAIENVHNKFSKTKMCSKTINIYREVLGIDQGKDDIENSVSAK